MICRLTLMMLFAVTLFISGESTCADNTTRYVVLDFTQPEIATKIARWEDPEYVQAASDGLGLKEQDSDYRDLTVETLTPTAVGWSWLPVTSVKIQAEVVASGESYLRDIRRVNSSMPNQLYVRYSPDCKNWSTWQALACRAIPDQIDPAIRFQGVLRIPKKTQRRYRQYLQEYSNAHQKPIVIDQYDAVSWIVDRDPAFFSKEIPFIGYVDFLFEATIKGDARLKKLQIEIEYSRKDRGPAPPDRHVEDAWNFRIPIDRKESAKKPLNLSESDDGKSVSVSVGTPIFISLPGSRATGYEWKIIEITGEAIKQTGEIEYQEDAEPNIIGRAGLFRLPVKAVRIGASTVNLGYFRPWEIEKPAARTFTVTVKVQ